MWVPQVSILRPGIPRCDKNKFIRSETWRFQSHSAAKIATMMKFRGNIDTDVRSVDGNVEYL